MASLHEKVSTRKSDDRSLVAHLQIQVETLETALYYPQQDLSGHNAKYHEEITRARNAIAHDKIYSAVFKWVPEDYYTHSLQKRAEILGAHSTFQLCKSMLMENKSFSGSEENETYSRFYLIVLQYETTINNKKLQSEIRALRPVKQRLDPSLFDFRVASEDDNAMLTGYSHNAVTPFGMLQDVPIILSKAITECSNMTPFVWMGGGHIHCKLGMAISDFLRAKKPLVLDVTDPRDK